MDADLDPAGWAQQAQFSGNVRAHRRSGKENANFTAQQAVLLMEPRDNLLRSVTANGGVHVDMHSDTPSGPQSRTLDTAALRLDFHSTPGPDPSSQISAAETLAPGAIGLNSPGDTTQVSRHEIQCALRCRRTIRLARGAFRNGDQPPDKIRPAAKDYRAGPGGDLRQ